MAAVAPLPDARFGNTFSGKSKNFDRSRTMRITSKGQVTIPKEIRDRAGLLPGTEVEFDYDGNVVRIMTPDTKENLLTRGQRLVEHLKSFSGQYTMTTEEVMALTRGED
jgi:AbrB family looped-hinge helix DNA binding protein